MSLLQHLNCVKQKQYIETSETCPIHVSRLVSAHKLTALEENKHRQANVELQCDGCKKTFCLSQTLHKFVNLRVLVFEGWIWVLLASVPGLCIFFTFRDQNNNICNGHNPS